MDAPQQYKQPSRKGKKAWRKNVDVSEVDVGLEVARKEIIAGGVVAEKPSDALFALDVKGSATIQKSYNRLHKPLMADHILALRSAVPPITSHKRSRVTDGVIEPRRKKPKSDVSRKDYERLKQIAYGGETLLKDMFKMDDAPDYDPWDTTTAQTEEDLRFSHLEKKKPIKAPSTLKRAPTSLVVGTEAFPAVAKPRPGTSYNPIYHEWNEVLTAEGQKEVEAEKKRRMEAQLEKERLNRIAAVNDERDDIQTEDESAWEGFDSECEGADSLKKRRPERKTPAERNKIKRRKATESQAKRDLPNKKKAQQAIRIKEIANKVEAEAEARMQAKSLSKLIPVEADDRLLRRRKLGKDSLPEPPLELVLPDELQDSLRLLKPEGNLLNERFRNILELYGLDSDDHSLELENMEDPRSRSNSSVVSTDDINKIVIAIHTRLLQLQGERGPRSGTTAPIAIEEQNSITHTLRMSSIDHDHERETAESPAEQTGVEVDAGSDTDTGKVSNSDPTIQDVSDGKYHARSNSIKKPISFKAVSVTKSFLAKAGTPVPLNKSNGEKGSSTPANSIPPVPRPRLVAKSANTHQTSAPKSMNLASRNGNGTGLDPNQVWNRNRPAPPTVPKHFTDEELKQQYGIHLATRLQADGDGKEAKWADIDDDEDDWAPETIEWNDGTKITLSHTDSAVVLAEEQAAALVLKEQQEEHTRAKMPPPKPTTTVGPNATVLRLGSGGPPRTGGLLLKNPSDKPTLVAKPPAPTPVRSPWAQLPPIDKVSPIPINAPAQLSALRSHPPDPSGPEGTGTPTSTTMEIAADSFTRTKRDTQSGSHGQLYNSQSGQYETVNPPRRGSMRKDQNFRPPSLLQRPSPNEQHGPAEPSSAFQTHRSLSQQEATMWNRRASSTMSGDSGPHGRRASMTKGSDIARIPQELLQQRRESQPLQSPLTPSPGHAKFPQETGPTQPSQQQLATPPTAPIGPPHLVEGNTTNAMLPSKPVTYGSLAASRTEDDVAAQRELMREKRALAIKRKKEEEQREALEKQERVRLNMLKLERLGISSVDEKKEVEKVSSDNKEHGTAPAKKEAESKEVETKNAESADNESKLVQPDKPKGLNQTVEVAAPRSPPKPPVLDASGTPKQYGLMKMHGPALANGMLQSIERHAADPLKVLATNQQGAPSSLEASKGGQPTTSSPKINGDTVEKVESRAPPSPETRNQDLFKAPRQQHWKGIQNDADPYTTWNGTGMTTHSSQVGSLWGLPTNFKALGNGTFDRSVQRPQPRQPFQEHYPTPQPIGPPKHLQRPRESPEPSRALDLMNQTAAEDSQTIPSYPSSDAVAISLVSRGNAVSQMINSENPDLASPPIPIPQPKPEVVAERPSRSQDERSSLAAWGNFHATSAREDAEKNRQAAQEKAARLAEEARTGIREPQGPILNETWRQVVINDTDGKRQVVSSSRSVHDPMAEPQLNGDIRNSPFATPPNIALGGGAGRGSRFFPGGLPPQPHNLTGLTLGIHRAASPPPPDSSYHPAYFRDQQRPLVNLPSPKPTVRLPPPSAIPVQSPAIVNIPIVPLKPVPQPKANNAEWQDRFNGLFGVKKPSPEKKFAHVAEFSATTKVPLEAPMIRISAAVSLPVRDEDTLEQTDDREVISKAAEDEEALFENREFGSLPTVLLPKNQPQAIQQKASKIQSRGLTRTKEVDSESVKNFEEKESELSNITVIFIKLAGMGTRKSKALPRSKNHGSNQGPPRNNRHSATNPKLGKNYKPRESSGSYSSTQKPVQQNNMPRNALPNGVTSQPRSQFGKQNLNWANQRVANAV